MPPRRFIAMEYIAGETLRARIARSRDVGETLELLVQIAVDVGQTDSDATTQVAPSRRNAEAFNHLS